MDHFIMGIKNSDDCILKCNVDVYEGDSIDKLKRLIYMIYYCQRNRSLDILPMINNTRGKFLTKEDLEYLYFVIPGTEIIEHFATEMELDGFLNFVLSMK